MPLNAQIQAIIDAAGAARPADVAPIDFTTISGADFRATFVPPAPSAAPVVLPRVEDLMIAGSRGPMAVRLYYPWGDGPFPITLYFHGSAFVVGSPDLTDGITRTLARDAGTLVVSVDYSLAPEAPFPAAVDDAHAALAWVHDQAGEIGGIATRIAVAGDSAGGTIAAVLAQESRHGGPPVRHQLLFYPVLDCAFDTPSYQANAEDPFLSRNMMRWAWRQYLPDPGLAAQVRASPLRQTDLAGVPPATIFTAEYDVLRDEGEAYAAALEKAGVAVTLKRWPGQVHAFLLMQGAVDDADIALGEAAAALRRALA
ncbi:alpha/beta hydrolase [Phreatobacter stygius]|uniref:Alpha/beta hydrolase n=1 Tax=Phreatobacter stygius TaxID=1940610 RepID=A0A4D7AR80_9HYPH|nr:alpha/beta hydrolase [Phreatobacter stygius]QCI63449.1 alpha/beta hydrolase [Phreatobacter stygius]